MLALALAIILFGRFLFELREWGESLQLPGQIRAAKNGLKKSK